MKRIVLCFWALVCGLGVAWAGKTQIATVDDALRSGTVYRLYNEVPFGGYFPLQVRLENRTNSEEEWNLVTRSDIDRDRGAALSFAKNLKVGPHSSAVYEVLIPMPSPFDTQSPRFSGQLFDYVYVNVEGSLIGPGGERHFNCSSNTKIDFDPSLTAQGPWSPVRIVGYDPAAEFYLPKEYFATGSKRPRAADRPDYQLIELGSESMLEDWRAYWGFGLIYLSSKEWGELGVLQKQAVMNWVRAGGCLVLPGWNHWAPGVSIPGLAKSDFVSGISYYGLGKVQLGEGKGGFVETVYDVQLEGSFPFSSANVSSLHGYDFESSANLTGYYMALLLFIALIGPVNVMWLCRGSRRYRVFVTTPLIVASCIALLFLYTILRDGIGGAGERMRLSVYGGGLNQVLRFQAQGAETGLILNRGFDVPEKAKLEAYYVSGASQKQFDIREGSYDGDWFRSRSKHSQLIAWSEPSREGVQVEPGSSGQAPVVSSRIKGTLKPFVFKDKAGGYWYAESLSLGEKKTLSQLDTPKAEDYLKQISKGNGETFLSKLTDRQLRASGVFFGELSNDQSAMVESLESIDWKDGVHLAIGKVKNATEGGL